jgi:cytochrome c oxidase subunit 2
MCHPLRRHRALTALLAALLLGGCLGGPRGVPPDAAGPASDATPGIGDAERGKRLFAARGCVGCHAVAGEFAGGASGPELRRALRQPTIAGGQPNTPETLWRYLENPQKVKPGTAMPRLPLSAQELDDLVAYLQTLRQ